MKILKVTDPEFAKYGKIVDIDTKALVETMNKMTIPQDVVYVPSAEELEALPIKKELEEVVYGEMDIQVGYCIGNNHYLNAVEYHRCSEINIAATDAILLVGCEQDITKDFTYETAKMEAFLLPKGCAAELYGTTLHYAPCNADDKGFLVAIVLPKNTNLPLTKEHRNGEDKLITARNKWLIGHKDAGLAEGTHIGLIGENLYV